MIRQISDREFSFSYREIPAQCKWGDNPHLDQLGATSHLTSTIEIINLEEFNWIREHKIPTTRILEYRYYHLRFDNIEDAMAFKLMWL